LIAVGVAADGDRLAFPFRVHQEFSQQLRCILFDDDFPFKIEPGAKAQVFVRIAGVSVNAAVFATRVRVHGIEHANIRAFYFVYDRLSFLLYVCSLFVGNGPLVDRFNMFFDDLIFMELIFGVYLSTAAFDIVFHERRFFRDWRINELTDCRIN
jgi:hypothetical protein